LKEGLKLWKDCLNSKAKQLLKQQLDFSFNNKIDTIDKLAKKIVETTVIFSI